MKVLKGLMLPFAMLLLNGCIIVGTPTTRDPYETCGSGDVCRGVSICRQANIAISGRSPGFQCSTTCATSADCPLDVAGRGGVCLEVTGSGTQCYRGCVDTTGCGAGFTCAIPNGTSVQVCIPN